MGFPPAITTPLAGNTQQYGGDLMTLIRNYLANVDIASADATLKPVIATETQYKNDKLTILQTDNNYKYALHILGTVTHDKTINVPALTLDADEIMLVKQAPNSEVEGKTFDYTKNTFLNFPPSTGEVNTASNYGTAGVGVFDSKNGVDLRFRNINPASNKLSAVFTSSTHTVDIDVNQANLALQSIGGLLTKSQLPASTMFNDQANTVDSGVTDRSSNQNPIMKVVNNVFTTGSSAISFYPTKLSTLITALDTSSPFNNVSFGITSYLTYGTVAQSPAPLGTAHAFSAPIEINASSDYNNEIANYFGFLAMKAGQPVSAWFTDFNVHGSVAVQPGLLVGVSMNMNNYYNGSPARAKSVNFVATTKPHTGAGTGTDSNFGTATSYPIDYAFAAVGYSGLDSAKTTGFTVAYLAGGRAGGWLSEASGLSSKIGTGFKAMDIEQQAFEIGDPASGSASSTVTGIKATGASRSYDTLIDLSGGASPTTAAIKIGNQRKISGVGMSLYDAGNGFFRFQPVVSTTFGGFSVLPSSDITTVASNSTRAIMRFYSTSDTTNGEYLAIEAHGTDGFLIFPTQAGTGTLRPLELQMPGNKVITINTDNSIGLNSRTVKNLVLENISDPSSLANRLWLNGSELRYWDNQGTPVKQILATLSTDQTFTTNAKRFNNNVLKWMNPAGTFSYTVVTSALTGSVNITLPLLTSSDSWVFAAFSQALTNKDLTDATNTFRQWVNADISASAAIALTKLSSSGAATNNVITWNGTNIVWAAPTGGGGGEANTASNQGVGGVGPFYQKSGVDLQFKNVNAGSNKISVTDDTTNHEIDIDLVVANITGLVDANIGSHTSTKISINNKTQLNANIAYIDQANTFGAFDQVFKSGNLKTRNPADTFSYIITGAAITADRILNLPLITGTDTLMTLGLDQLVTQPKRFAVNTLKIQNPAATFNYIFVSSAITASRNITLPLLGSDDTIAFIGFNNVWSVAQNFPSGSQVNSQTIETQNNKNAASGYAGLNSSSKLAITTLDNTGAATNNVITWNGSSIVWAAPTGGGLTDPPVVTYIDYTRIAAPSNPAANFGRMYVKQIDTNNDGLFILLKKAGSYTEVQIS